MVVVHGLWRYLVILGFFLWFFGILVLFGGSYWFLVIFCCSLWYFVVLVDPWCFLVMMLVILMIFLG